MRNFGISIGSIVEVQVRVARSGLRHRFRLRAAAFTGGCLRASGGAPRDGGLVGVASERSSAANFLAQLIDSIELLLTSGIRLFN